MSGFDDLPGFGPAGGSSAAPGFDAPGFDAPGFSAPGFAPPQQQQQQSRPQGAPQQGGYGGQQGGYGGQQGGYGGGGYGGGYGQPQMHHQHMHHHHHHHSSQPQSTSPQPQGGSLYGNVVGGSAKHSYQMKTYDLPPAGGAPSYGGAPGSYGGGAPGSYGGGAPGYGGGAPMGGGPMGGRGGARPLSGPPPPGPATNTVFLGSVQAEDDELREWFGRYGRVLRIGRIRDKNVGFVHFQYEPEAKAAVEAAHSCGTYTLSARVGYGKMFDYNQEELERIARQEQARLNRNSGLPERREREEMPPSNIVFVAEVPPHAAEDDLRRHFAPFGRVTTVRRVEHKGLAFVHFETVEEATRAIRSLRGLPFLGSPIRVDYGKAQRTEEQRIDEFENQPATNVVWVGGIPGGVSNQEVDALFQSYEGFIDARLLHDKGIAFGHFETIEQATKCRNALQGQSLHNHTLRVGFGKTNHTKTKNDVAPPAFDQFGNPMLVPPGGFGPGGAPGAGQLVAHQGAGQGDLMALPEEGQGAQQPMQLVPRYMSRQRPVPTITLDHKINALGAASYFSCTVPPPHLPPEAVADILDHVDATSDEFGIERLITDLRTTDMPQYAPHAYTLVAKRLKEYHNTDPHRKLLVYYAAAIRLHEGTDQRNGLDTFAMLTQVVAENQDRAGADIIETIVKSLHRYLDANNDLDAVLLSTFDSIIQKQRAASDVEGLLNRFKKN